MPKITAAQAKALAVAAINAANTLTEEQLLTKYDILFKTIENTAKDKKFDLVVGFTATAYSELIKLLQLYGYTVTVPVGVAVSASLNIGSEVLLLSLGKGAKANASILNIPSSTKVQTYNINWGTTNIGTLSGSIAGTFAG
jgi:hypothetical protein